MTDPTQLPPPDDPLDLAASAIVDGTATDAERALVESTAEGQARVRQFRAVADAVGSPPPAQDARVADAAIAAALEAVPSAAIRDRQRRQVRWLAPVAAVAAAVVVVLGVGSLVITNEDDSRTTTAEFADRAATTATTASNELHARAPQEAATDAASGAAGGASAAAPSAAASTIAPVIDGGELGRVTDPNVLAAHAKAAIDGETASAPSTGAPTSDDARCDRANRTRAGSTLGALRYRAIATYAGTPALVLAYDATDGTSPPRILEVVARDDCRRLAAVRF
jgi:hypothetical protein